MNIIKKEHCNRILKSNNVLDAVFPNELELASLLKGGVAVASDKPSFEKVPEIAQKVLQGALDSCVSHIVATCGGDGVVVASRNTSTTASQAPPPPQQLRFPSLALDVSCSSVPGGQVEIWVLRIKEEMVGGPVLDVAGCGDTLAAATGSAAIAYPADSPRVSGCGGNGNCGLHSSGRLKRDFRQAQSGFPRRLCPNSAR